MGTPDRSSAGTLCIQAEEEDGYVLLLSVQEEQNQQWVLCEKVSDPLGVTKRLHSEQCNIKMVQTAMQQVL